MGVLDDILRQKRAELPALRAARLPAAPPPRTASLKRGPGEPLRLITEIKLKSPSAGELSRALSVGERAQAYERGGASMVSVLCDARFFGGGYQFLAEAHAACELPLLCKEFVIDEIQLDAARAYGASAVLLIVRCLPGNSLPHLIDQARARDLLPVVEVCSGEEARRALDSGAETIGVNSRDLDTLEMNPARADEVLSGLPSGVTRAYFSGVKSEAGVAHARRLGADAALIGEILMRQDDPEPLLRSFVLTARDGLS